MQLTATDRQAVAKYDLTQYARPSVAVDMVALCYSDQQLKILLIRRRWAPYTGGYALPGGFIQPGKETAPQAVIREIREETGAVITEQQIEQLGFYTELGRDPRGNIYSSTYLALLPEEIEVKGEDDALDAEWFAITRDSAPGKHNTVKLSADTIEYTITRDLTNAQSPLAFDHHKIIFDALDRLRSGLFYKNQALELLGSLFTLPEVSDLYSLITFGRVIKRKWKSGDLIRRLGDTVVATKHTTEGMAHRPATLYQRNPASITPTI